MLQVPDDPRLHSVRGRELYEAERQAWLKEGGAEKFDSLLAGEANKEMQMEAINIFAQLFSD